MLVEGPKENPLPAVCLFATPNMFVPLLALPKGELAAGPPVPAPNKEPDGAVLAGVLPKSPPPPVVAGAFTADPKGLPETGALDADCPKNPAPPFDVEV